MGSRRSGIGVVAYAGDIYAVSPWNTAHTQSAWFVKIPNMMLICAGDRKLHVQQTIVTETALFEWFSYDVYVKL